MSELLFNTSCFSSDAQNVMIKKGFTHWIQIESNQKLYELLTKFIPENSLTNSSYLINELKASSTKTTELKGKNLI